MKKQSTTKGFAVLSAATIIVKLLSLLYIPFLTKIITQDGWGVYSSAYQIFTWVYVLANAGIPVAISKLVSEQMAMGRYKDAIKSFKIARLIMFVLGILSSVILFIFASQFAEMFESSRATLSLMALAPTLLFTSILSAYRGYFQGRGNMQPTAISQVLEQVANTVFTLVFAAIFIKYGVEAGAAGGTLGTSIGAFLSAIYMIYMYEKNKVIKVPKGFIDKSNSSNKAIFKKILFYAVPIVVCVGLQYSGNIIDMWNVKSRLLSIGYSIVQTDLSWGLLSKYRTLLGVPIALISALQMSILPALSGASALKDRVAVETKINYAFRFCFLVAVPSAIGLAVLGKPMFILLQASGGENLLYFGSIVLIFNSIVLIQTTILQSIGKMYLSTLYIIIGIVGKIVVNYILVGIPEINIVGAVFGNLVMFVIPLILNYKLIKKLLKIRVRLLKHIAKPLLASVFMGIIVLGTFSVIFNLAENLISPGLNNAVASLFSIGMGVIAYMYGLVFTKGITKEDIDDLPLKFKKFIPKLLMNKLYE
ncbi:polysaccharide biosynthesis protein [Clostridium sediminicola]|uniref:putative polysaccharide biosynthesis protein n=1 Tax=Clostridium sediminicola TaxID=3114879 RepID=UPI0031F242B2